MDAPTFGSLFSGIGGIDRGLEAAGWRPIWQSEKESYPAAVLAHHWPDVPNLGDITEIDWRTVERPDLIAGGFPCQDISRAGLKAGIGGSRSGLWSYMADAIRHLRPRYVFVENVSDLVFRGLDAVLGDLHQLGFDAEWSVVSACAVGAPHTRERLFIVAYHPDRDGEGQMSPDARAIEPGRRRFEPRGSSGSAWRDWWVSEPALDRVAHGVPSRLVRQPLFALGNAAVPQVVEWIGSCLIQSQSDEARMADAATIGPEKP